MKPGGPGEKIDRRNLLHFLGAATVAGGLALLRTPGRRGPNLLLITADDLGHRCLGCYGDPNARTPNLDRLAQQGVRFNHAFVAAPSCSASRAAFITGQSPHSVGVLGLTQIYPEFQMPTRHPTLARELVAAGYQTSIQGKWHVAPSRSPLLYGYQVQANSTSIESAAAANHYISINKNRPFYLELNFIQTHRPPSRGPQGHAFKLNPQCPVDPEAIKIPPDWDLPDWPDLKQDIAAYYCKGRRMDTIIGEILDHLDRERVADRTLVVFVSDNGQPYPGAKMMCYDRGIGVPLLMRWPEGLPSGKVVDGLVSGVDLMPTSLDAAGVAIPDPVQGVSLLPMARGETEEVNDAVFAEMTYHEKYIPMRAIRTRDWKFILNLSPDPPGLDRLEDLDWARRLAELPGQKCCVPRPPEELYHLADDPNEKNNLADHPAHQAIKQDLKTRLNDWRIRTRDPYPDLVPDLPSGRRK